MESKILKTHKNTWAWGKTHTLIIYDGAGLVNISIENDNPTVATIHGISVIESYRRKGMGRLLLKLAEIEAKEMGAELICIATEPNSWIEEWYKRNGYKFNSYDENNLIVLMKDI